MTPDQPEPVDFSDFTADVAARTGESSENLTGRSEPVAEGEDVLLDHAARLPDALFEREPLLEIAAQYDAATKRLFEWFGGHEDWRPEGGVLQPLDGHGKEFILPTREHIMDALDANPELYSEKIKQGFTKLLIVPEGAHLAHLMDAWNRLLQRGIALPSGSSQKAVGWTLGKHRIDDMCDLARTEFGYVESYGDEPVIKADRLAEEGVNSAWRVCLVQDIASEGRGDAVRGESVTVTASRPFVKARRDGGFARCVLGTGATRGEQGLTPESYLALSADYLLQHGKLLDAASYTVLLGFKPVETEGGVIYMARDSDDHKLTFDLRPSTEIPGVTVPNRFSGLRTVVPIPLLIDESGIPREQHHG
jgi:hypothetical protein